MEIHISLDTVCLSIIPVVCLVRPARWASGPEKALNFPEAPNLTQELQAHRIYSQVGTSQQGDLTPQMLEGKLELVPLI